MVFGKQVRGLDALKANDAQHRLAHQQGRSQPALRHAGVPKGNDFNPQIFHVAGHVIGDEERFARAQNGIGQAVAQFARRYLDSFTVVDHEDRGDLLFRFVVQ